MTSPVVQEPAVVVEGLRYRFAEREAPSLSDITFTLAPGTLNVVAGRTGSGKSTLLRALAGLIPHHAAGEMLGSVQLFGRDTRSAGTHELAATVGLVLQSPDEQLCTTSVESEMAFGLANLGLPVEEITHRTGHWLDRMQLAAKCHQSTTTLSGGQKQRLLLASVMAMGTRLLLLDEPLAQLDPLGAADLLDLLDELRRDGLTIIVAEHRLEDLMSRADRILIVDRGQVLADGIAQNADIQEALKSTRLVVDARINKHSNASHADIATKNPHPIISASNLAVRFSRKLPPIWQGLNLAIQPGERVTVVGPNGSGKSTLLHVLAGLQRRSEGRIEMSAGERGIAPVALVPQNPDLTLIAPTVADELSFGPRRFGLSVEEATSRSHDVAERLGIAELLDEPPLALSQGQRLRVALASVLTIRPRLLLLDEPTTGQDPGEVQRLLAVLTESVAKGETGAILFSTHDLRIAAQFASRVLVLADGKVLADGPTSVYLADEALLERARLRRGTRMASNGLQAHAPESENIASRAGAP
ncbi:MAG TPA: ABC transporter ATP-binding protein [Pirellulales bacterium]|jgi:energy-coupling factor transport system ATP-binding protein